MNQPVADNQKPLRILVADDEPWFANPVCYALEAEGFEVCRSKTGSETLEKISSPVGRPALLILDVMMDPGTLPGETDGSRAGIAVLRIIRNELKLTEKELPVVCMTVLNNESAQREIENLHGKYLSKQTAGIAEIFDFVLTKLKPGI